MKGKISFKLIFKSKTFEIPFQFKHLTEVNQDIFEQIISKHEYYIKSNVNEEIFKNFIDFWVNETEPEISIRNYYQYSQLSQEFNIMKDFLDSSKSNWNEYEQTLYLLSDPTIDDKNIIEQKVAQNLDDYIENQGENLIRQNVHSLYNIFNHKHKKFTKHDRAYELFCQRFIETKDSEIFILLKYIEGQKISFENLKDSILKSDKRFGFLPNLNVSVFENLFNEIQITKEKCENQTEIINELKGQCHNQTEIISELKEQCEKQKQEIQELTQNIEVIKNMFSEFKEKQENENKEIKLSIKEIEMKNDECKNQIKEEIGKQEEKMLNIQNCSNGIIRHLTNECGGNVNDKGIVKLTASSLYSSNTYPLQSVVDIDEKETAFVSGNKPNSWIKYDFIQKKIHPTHYLIRSSHNNKKGYCNLKSWVIEGSNTDQENSWKILDSRNDVTYLDDLGAFHKFEIQPPLQNDEYYRYVRIRQTKTNAHNNNFLVISALEYYGSIRISED